ncbi:MAG: fibronectin type III domain-containing protein [Alkalispirochaeta sp.]
MVVGATLLSFAGCDTTMDSIGNSDRPTNVSASDGEFSDRIEISWTAPNPVEEDAENGDESPELIGYDVRRWDAETGSVRLSDTVSRVNPLGSDTTSYVDTRSSLRLGVLYEYEIIAVYSDNTTTSSTIDTGYAISATDIPAGSNLDDHRRSYDTTQAPTAAGGKVWFRLLVQRGWSYEVRAVEDASTTEVRMLHERQLHEQQLEEPAQEPTEDSETGPYTFTADRNGFYFIELSGGSGTVSVRYLGAQ